jgi:hypothetical protein
VVKNNTPTKGDLNNVVEKMEMSAQKIWKKSCEILELQKDNELEMVKQLEETKEQLANQVEKMFYEECQKISTKELSQLMARGKKLEDEKETCEVIVELHKKNSILKPTQGKSTHEKVLK